MVEETEQDLSSTQQAIPASVGFRPLDRRVIGLWRLSNAVGFGILLLALLVAIVVFGLIRPYVLLWMIPGWFALALFCGWFSYWYPERAYRAWGYRIDAKVLETQRGIVFRVTRLLPLTRLQHVDLRRGPFERMFGLASLVLHTAGTHAASLTIPGLEAEEAVRLRNHLVEIGGDDAV